MNSGMLPVLSHEHEHPDGWGEDPKKCYATVEKLTPDFIWNMRLTTESQ